MIIQENSDMLLFRYSNYRRTDFIEEHKKVIKEAGYTWLLKAGKKSDMSKLNSIKDAGGAFVLKSPVKDGNKYYICSFSEVSCDEPYDDTYPNYYHDFLDDNYEFDGGQWFKVKGLRELPSKYIESLLLKKTRAKVVDVLPTTRTAVMFIVNDTAIEL